MKRERNWHIVSGQVDQTAPGIAWGATESGYGFEGICYFKDQNALRRFADQRGRTFNSPVTRAVRAFVNAIGWYADSPLGDDRRPGYLLIEWGKRAGIARPRVAEVWIRRNASWATLRRAVVAPPVTGW